MVNKDVSLIFSSRYSEHSLLSNSAKVRKKAHVMFWIWICVDLALLDIDPDPDPVAVKLI
jgi:hypothetical protein